MQKEKPVVKQIVRKPSGYLKNRLELHIMFQQGIHLPLFLKQRLQLRPVFNHAALFALVEDAFHLLIAEVRMVHQSLEIRAVHVDFRWFSLTYYNIWLNRFESFLVYALHVAKFGELRDFEANGGRSEEHTSELQSP